MCCGLEVGDEVQKKAIRFKNKLMTLKAEFEVQYNDV